MPEKATASSWKTKPMPDAQKELRLSGVYSAEEYEKISYGYLPKSQEDKWFIYLEGDWLNFHRSWTGTCVFQLQIIPEDDDYQAVKVIVNRDPAQYRNTNDRQDVQMIAYLIDHLLLDRFAAFPTPRNMSEADQQRHRRHVMGKQAADDIIRLQMKKNGGQQRP
jgi:hypothetical protein